jgi:hypothetical protein
MGVSSGKLRLFSLGINVIEMNIVKEQAWQHLPNLGVIRMTSRFFPGPAV